ncbi:MAG TPA: hypothetical protein VFX38_00745 [Gammaproteobacteria bacterium]|nr:hypothetical protein [Gammaproteobacteria bacterium]
MSGIALSRSLRSRLRRFLRDAACASRSSLVIPDGMDGFVHVATAFVRPDGIYLLETLEGEGRLTAGERLPEWALSGKRRFHFPNPLTALELKVAAARLIAGAIPLQGFLVLDDRLELPLACPPDVVVFAQLAERLPPLAADARPLPAYLEAWARFEAAGQAAS